MAGLAPSRASPALGRAGASFRAAGRGRGDCSVMPALGGDPLDPDLGGRIASFSPRARRRRSPAPSGGGHRSLNPNVTPPGLRPGGREGESQARRCRSRVSVRSSASGPVRRSAGSTRRAPSCASSSWAAGRGGGSAMPVLGGDPLDPDLGGRTASFLAETPVTEPQRHSPRSTTGGPGGRAAGEAMPFPRQRSVVGLWAGTQVGRLDPSGAVMRKLVVLANAWWTGPPLVARTVRARRRGSVAGSVPFASACARVHNPRQRAPWSAVDRLWQLRLTRRPPWPRAAAPPGRRAGSRKSTVGLLPISAGFAAGLGWLPAGDWRWVRPFSQPCRSLSRSTTGEPGVGVVQWRRSPGVRARLGESRLVARCLATHDRPRRRPCLLANGAPNPVRA